MEFVEWKYIKDEDMKKRLKDLIVWMFPYIRKQIEIEIWLKENREREARNKHYEKQSLEPIQFFNVSGAGKIAITHSTNWQTGGSVRCPRVQGFHFGVEWGLYGYTSGVLDKKEAEALANFILERLSIDNQ